MERDGLLRIPEDRQLALSDIGHTPAPAVMRRHRLAERMLVEISTLPWPEGRIEACRGEHVSCPDKVASADGARVVSRQLGAPIHSDLALMHKVGRAGIQPGREVILMAAGDGVCVTAGSSADLSAVELPRPVAAPMSVSGLSRYRPAAAGPAAGA